MALLKKKNKKLNNILMLDGSDNIISPEDAEAIKSEVNSIKKEELQSSIIEDFWQGFLCKLARIKRQDTSG